MAGKHKAILKIGYMTFVMEAKAAATLFPLLVEGGGEVYDTHWNPDTKESEPRIQPMEVGALSLQMLTEEAYAMGKLLYAAEIASKETKEK